MTNRLISPYDGITRYAGVPTEQITGRLHYNENLYGPSPKCIDSLKELHLSDLYLYESNEREDLIDVLSEEIGIPGENLFLNNGSAENIKTILNVFTDKGDTVLFPDPGWSYYTGIADYKFLNIVKYQILEGEDSCSHDVEGIMTLAKEHNPKVIIITTPAMPTGNKMADEDIELIVKSFPDTLVVIDEAYLGFSEYSLDIRRLIETYDNVVFSRTFSKLYGLANLRIGYGFCSSALKKVLWLDMPLHRLSHISKRMAIAALKDKDYYNRVVAEIQQSKEEFSEALNAIPGVKVLHSDANFVYIRLKYYDVERIKSVAQENGYLIRIFTGNKEKHLRITIGTKELMEEFIPFIVETIKASKL